MLLRARSERARPTVRWPERARPTVRWPERARPTVRRVSGRDSQVRTATTPRKDTASTKNTAVSPVAAMTIPATPGPAILARPVTVANSEVPRRSSPGPTRSSINVWRAGRSTHWTQPVAKDSGTRYQSVIHPASNGTPMASDAAASRAWVTTATRTARYRNTTVPARRLNSSIGRERAASTAARAGAPPCRSAAPARTWPCNPSSSRPGTPPARPGTSGTPVRPPRFWRPPSQINCIYIAIASQLQRIAGGFMLVIVRGTGISSAGA